MKILTQDKGHLIDTAGADIFVKEDSAGCFELVLEKKQSKHSLGTYEEYEHAIRELRRVYVYINANYKLYEMRSARYYVGRY